jgi:LysR family transcriptional regulator of beta-lactamase
MNDALAPVCAASAAALLGAPADLAAAVLLHDEDQAAAWWRWTEAAGLGRPAWAARGPRLGAVALLIQAAAAGEGVALVPERLAARHLADGRLVAPFSNRVDLGPVYWLIRPSRGISSASVRAFCRWLHAESTDS